MAKNELFKNRIFGFILKNLGAFPVKRGAPDLGAIKKSLQVLKEDHVFGIFPEGTRSKEGDIQHFSLGAASIAHRSKSPIIPIGIIGDYKLFKPVKIFIGQALDLGEYFAQKTNLNLIESMSKEMENSLKILLTMGDLRS